jgi:hypothetical protein
MDWRNIVCLLQVAVQVVKNSRRQEAERSGGDDDDAE